MSLSPVQALFGQVGVFVSVSASQSPVLPEYTRLPVHAGGGVVDVAAHEVLARAGDAGVALPERVGLPVGPRDAPVLAHHLLQERRPRPDVHLGPAPERPIREHDVQRAVVLAVHEQRRRGGRVRERAAAHQRDVAAEEHEVQVRDAARVPGQQLQDAPQREHVPGLERPVDLLHVRAPVHDHQTERRHVRRALHRLPSDALLAPRRQVGVDVPELVWA
jgi:hypothetical protein